VVNLKTASAQKRYFFTLFVNTAKMALGFLNATIVPRCLGPTVYGDYNFITNTALSINSFADLNASNAFYTYSSERKETGLAFYIYYLWVVFQLIILIASIWIVNKLGYAGQIFPDQKLIYIYIITVLVWLDFLSTSLIKFGESKAENIYVQKINLISGLIKCFAFILLFYLGIFSFNNFLIVNYLIPLFICSAIIIFLIKTGIYIRKTDNNNKKEIIKYFITYCYPLFIVSIFGFADKIFHRWFLQKISGSLQQGFFSVAYQWSMIVILFSSSMIYVLWREISFHYRKQDIYKVRQIFLKSYKSVHFLCSFLSLFLAINAKTVLIEFAGEKYSNATTILVLMAFYPIYYSLNQIFTIYFYATARVKLLRNITMISTPIGIVITYLLLAPKTFLIPGFELGAMGLTVNMLVVTILLSNIYAYFPLKELGLSFYRFAARQLWVLLLLSPIAFLAASFASIIKFHNLLNLILMFAIYSLLAFALVYIKPVIIGITKVERDEYKRKTADFMWKFIFRR
jgi:O-antigen/teichoic acid export membrane protein